MGGAGDASIGFTALAAILSKPDSLAASITGIGEIGARAWRMRR